MFCKNFRIYFGILMIFCSFSCKPEDPRTGCLLGYDNQGIGIIKLQSRNRINLTKNKKWLVAPILDEKNDRLYCINKESNTIVLRRENKFQDIYKIPDGYDTEWLILDNSKKFLYFIQYKPGNPPHTLIKYDLDNDRIDEFLVYNFYVYQRPAWIDNYSLLFLSYRMSSNGELEFKLEKLNTERNQITPIIDNFGRFDLHKESKKIIVNISDDYKVYQYPDMDLLQTIPGGIMPDTTKITSPFCFTDDDHVVFWKWRNREIGLGTYIINLQTLKYCKISKYMLWGMHYSNCPLGTGKIREAK